MRKAYLATFLFLSSITTFADQRSDDSLAQKAKTKQYPGGVDEADLKVQTTINTPTRKMAPQVEKIDESPTEDQQ